MNPENRRRGPDSTSGAISSSSTPDGRGSSNRCRNSRPGSILPAMASARPSRCLIIPTGWSPGRCRLSARPTPPPIAEECCSGFGVSSDGESISRWVPDAEQNSLGDDFQIEPQAPILDIAQIKLQALFHCFDRPRLAATAVDLCQPGDSRFDMVAK